ncbi:MAG: cellulase family glycosylhydrolase [Bacteroidota bacterium]
MHFKDGYRLIDNKKQFVMGINYLPASTGHSIKFYTDPDFKEIEADCKLMASMQFKAVRIGLPYDMVDNNKKENSVITANLEKFISLCDDNKLKVIPTFFHLASFQEDPNAVRPEWTKADHYYTSDESFSYITKYMEILALHYAYDDRIFAWDVGNEPYWHAGFPAKNSSGVPDRTIMTAYANKLVSKFHSLGFKQPLTFGADHASIVQEVGADIVGLMDVSDFVSSHFYSKYNYDMFKFEEINSFRDTYFGTYIMKFSQHNDKPLACFEFGNSTMQISEENQAVYQRVLSYSCFVAGANSLLPWAFCDIDQKVRHLYNNNAQQELEFGLLRADKSPKPAAKELQDFINTINAIDLEQYSFAKPEAAIYVDKAYYDRLAINFNIYPNAYMLARAANIPVSFVRHDEDLSRYKLLFVPNGLLTIEGMDRITSFVEQGGTVYMSFNKHIHAMAPGYLQNLFGFKLLDYRRMPKIFEVFLNEEYAPKNGENRMVFQGMEPPPSTYTYYKIEPKSAAVIACDKNNQPVLSVNTYGKGCAIACMFPVEMVMARTDDAFQNIPAYLFYSAALKHSSIKQEVSADNPFVELGLMKSKGSGHLLFLINHEPFAQSLKLKFEKEPKGINDFKTGSTVQNNLSLDANEVRILRLMTT